MRLFLAIELTEPVRRHLDQVRTRMLEPFGVSDAVTWVARENWHITLKFLGEVATERLESLRAALATIPLQPMQLFADRAILFPSRGRVHVIGLGIGGDSGRLNKLHDDVETAIEPLGFTIERREYTAHITLGRSRHGIHDSGYDSLRGLRLGDLFPGPHFEVDRIALFESRLRPQGSEYEKLATIPWRCTSDPNIS